jgi:hypothetical protein
MVFSWFGVLLRTASGGSVVATAVTPIWLARADRSSSGTGAVFGLKPGRLVL